MSKPFSGKWHLVSDAQGPFGAYDGQGRAIFQCGDTFKPRNGWKEDAVKTPKNPHPCKEAASGQTYRPERVATVRILYASRELLAACEFALGILAQDNVNIAEKDYNMVRDAVAKAKGEIP